jgi:hypothetical protein
VQAVSQRASPAGASQAVESRLNTRGGGFVPRMLERIHRDLAQPVTLKARVQELGINAAHFKAARGEGLGEGAEKQKAGSSGSGPRPETRTGLA